MIYTKHFNYIVLLTVLNLENIIYISIKKNIISIFRKKYYVICIIKKKKYVNYKKLLLKCTLDIEFKIIITFLFD